MRRRRGHVHGDLAGVSLAADQALPGLVALVDDLGGVFLCDGKAI